MWAWWDPHGAARTAAAAAVSRLLLLLLLLDRCAKASGTGSCGRPTLAEAVLLLGGLLS